MGAVSTAFAAVTGGIGALLTGIGLFEGSSDLGSAAKGAGREAEAALGSISGDVTQLRVFIQKAWETAWPEFNRTLAGLRGVFDAAKGFLDYISQEVTHFLQKVWGTAWPEFNRTLVGLRGVFDAAKVFLKDTSREVTQFRHFVQKAWEVAWSELKEVLDITDVFLIASTLLVVLCIGYVIHSQRRVQQNNITAVVRNTILEIVYSLCLISVVVLVLQLVGRLFHWSHSIPFIILIPSLSTLGILYQHLVSAVKKILSFFQYVMIDIPFRKFSDPLVKGYRHMSIRNVLFLCIIYFVPYVAVPYGAYLYVAYLVQSEKSFWKRAIIAYGVSYAATMIINDVITATWIISHLVGRALASLARRAFLARRNLQGQ